MNLLFVGPFLAPKKRYRRAIMKFVKKLANDPKTYWEKNRSKSLMSTLRQEKRMVIHFYLFSLTVQNYTKRPLNV
jgi:hypothetical protein